MGEALRLVRIYHDRNKTEMAAELGMSVSYLSEIESEKKQPSIDILNRYAALLHVPLSSLLFFSEEVKEVSHSEKLRAALAPKVLSLLRFLADERDHDNERKQKEAV